MADLTVTAGSVLPGTSTVERGVAGAAITAGQCIYLDSAANTLKLAQCDGTAAEVDAVGIALNSAGIGQPVIYARGGPMNIGATTAKTTTYVVATTAGGICPQADLSSGNRICRLGYATATDGTFVVDIKNHSVAV